MPGLTNINVYYQQETFSTQSLGKDPVANGNRQRLIYFRKDLLPGGCSVLAALSVQFAKLRCAGMVSSTMSGHHMAYASYANLASRRIKIT